ncbi:hypothetical protein WN48_10600 [Eufriesea mexicana]|uniref:Uncharacterized protein n=1 Tax=Eufriesea mexicana TaxID=516756 RepID=A0A310SE39_9HYME|nr:hypothetical protein WN48_10600 [Eufriesea mexicana]
MFDHCEVNTCHKPFVINVQRTLTLCTQEERPRSPRPRSSPAHKTYQRKRVDNLRRDRGILLDAELSKALREKLLPGVKNEQTVAERLDHEGSVESPLHEVSDDHLEGTLLSLVCCGSYDGLVFYGAGFIGIPVVVIAINKIAGRRTTGKASVAFRPWGLLVDSSVKLSSSRPCLRPGHLDGTGTAI